MIGFIKRLLNAPKALDIEVNEKTQKKHHWWSDWGGKKGETISSSFGDEEAEMLYLEYMRSRKLSTPYISLKDHPVGQFSEDICTAIQSVASGRKRYHGLESIENWDVLEAKYPGIKKVVTLYLKKEGVKV
jgi:hypothetical protein